MKKQPAYILLLIFLFLIAGISIGAYFYYRYAKQSYRSEVDRQLSAIADLKVKEIMEWRKERLNDAVIFYKNDVFSGLVKDYFENKHTPSSLRHLRQWLSKIKQYPDYEDIFLVDIQGINRMSVGNPVGHVSSVISTQLSEMKRTRQITFQDFYRDETDGQIYLAVFVPVIDMQDSSRILGMLALQIDPKHYLYPFINTWPIPSRTSETLIVRRDGNTALFLNEPRFDTNAALSLRISRKRIEMPAVRAVLGWQGGFKGIDYRGVPVIAAVRTIPNSPWAMVAKTDISEAFAPLTERLLVLAIPSSIILISLFVGMGLALRQRNVRFYKEQFKSAEALRNSEKKFKMLFNSIPDAVFIHDLDGRFLEVNSVVSDRLGYSHDDLLQMSVKDIDTPESILKIPQNLNKLTEKERIIIESAHVHRNGTVIPVEISGRLFEYDGSPAVLSVARDITERKQIEKQLLLQSTALNAAENGIVITDPRGTIQWVNPSFIKGTGYAVEDILGKNPSVLNSGRHEKSFYTDLWETIGSGKVWIGEIINRYKDGSEHTEEMTITPVLDPEGRITHYIAIKQDITERKRIEDLIRQSDERYHALIQTSLDGFWITDPEGHLKEVNTAYSAMTGYTEEQLLNMQVSDLEANESPEDTFNHIQQLLEKGWDRFESKHRCADGKILDVLISTIYLHSQQIFLVFINDITERKQKEEKIRRLQQQTDFILGATHTGLDIIDPEYNLLYVSPGFARIYGDISDKKCYEYFKGLQDVCQECRVKEALDSRSVTVYESKLPLENDRPIQVTTIPFQDETGRLLAAEVSVDISERKRIENELLTAKMMAEEANRAKSEFLSRMSHELRTPLNSILGFAQLMETDELQPRQKKGIEHILSSGQHLLGLINEVLDIARIESGRFALSLESVQLCDVIGETLDIVRPMAEARRVSIELTEPPVDLQSAWADHQRLKQILLNLISNAVKYNHEGGTVTIECADAEMQECRPEIPLSSFVRISVTDTGSGISQENLKKIFTPFERFEAEQQGIEGSGLGLAIAKKLVEAMDGTIGVESEPGAGSTFWVELPAMKDEGRWTKEEGRGTNEESDR